MKLSVIIPVYNEENTITAILDKVSEVQLFNNVEKELVIVNDCSVDKSHTAIQEYVRLNPQMDVTYLQHDVNKGKGAAIHTGIRNSSGDYIIIQDADLEYDPNEYNLMLRPIMDGFADVVFGSRFLYGNSRQILCSWHTIGNRILTVLSNTFTNLNLSDMETCFKLFKSDILKSLELRENRFGFEPEVTAKVSRCQGIRIYEVGISYCGRTYEEGKKINWKDGVRAIYCIIKYSLF